MHRYLCESTTLLYDNKGYIHFIVCPIRATLKAKTLKEFIHDWHLGSIYLVTTSNIHNIKKGVVLPPCNNYSLHIIIIETLNSIKMESKAHPAIHANIYTLCTNRITVLWRRAPKNHSLYTLNRVQSLLAPTIQR